MSLISNPAIQALRRVGRITGANKLLARLILGDSYEEKFSARLLASIRQGDTVWDVGANVGYYTIKFAEIVGPQGRVFAFEPSPSTFTKLQQAVSDYDNISPLNLGFAEAETMSTLEVGNDDLQATSKVSNNAGRTSEKKVERISLRRADSLLATGEASVPSVIKIDVEGHERFVLEGMGEMLLDPLLREVFVEVHFGIIDESGRSRDVRKIVDLLEQSNFNVSWVDPSHIQAMRVSA